MTSVHISVVVPCFDEIDVIDAFHRELVAALEPTAAPFEICYVDDGSRDGTGARLKDLAAADPHVRHTPFSRNFGKEPAMLAGLRTCCPVRRSTRATSVRITTTVTRPLTAPYHWWPAIGNCAYRPTRRPLPSHPLSVNQNLPIRPEMPSSRTTGRKHHSSALGRT
ncbi:glycosyltransferase [Streptomyces sp. NPDC003023]|uniref:glycosyltransferase n=1 Tax=Streptomyces sp. NPDC003023 TaxID=3364675 RepID=UPI0036D08E2F